MGFLNRILNRPTHEKPFVLLVVGHSAEDALVPEISRKPLNEIGKYGGTWRRGFTTSEYDDDPDCYAVFFRDPDGVKLEVLHVRR